MAVASVTVLPQVVKRGGAVENRFDYTSNDTMTKGDLIRITTAGTIKLAALDSDTVGAVHGIVLQNHAAATDIACPVLLFAEDTVIRMQLADSTDTNDIAKGEKLIFDAASVTGTWALSSTTTKGIATVVGFAQDRIPWNDKTGTYSYSATTDNGFADVQFGTDSNNLSVLQGRAAE
jgi:hypothetical protein